MLKLDDLTKKELVEIIREILALKYENENFRTQEETRLVKKAFVKREVRKLEQKDQLFDTIINKHIDYLNLIKQSREHKPDSKALAEAAQLLKEKDDAIKKWEKITRKKFESDNLSP